MQEFTVDTAGWNAFWDRWKNTIDKIPGLKEAMLEKLGWIKSDKLMRFGPYGVQRGFIKPKTED